jgi:hypothetical protein
LLNLWYGIHCLFTDELEELSGRIDNIEGTV